MPTINELTNEQRSAAEVAAFIAEKPARYFAYHDAQRSGVDPITRLHVGDKITTWTGDELATVIGWPRDPFGAPYRSNMDDVRQAFRARGINGVTYSGTAYLSAGDYVRMTAVMA